MGALKRGNSPEGIQETPCLRCLNKWPLSQGSDLQAEVGQRVLVQAASSGFMRSLNRCPPLIPSASWRR